MATETYLLSIQGSLQGQYRENVIAFQSAGLGANQTLDNAGNLINAFIAHGQTPWLATQPVSYSLDLLSARRAFPKPSATAYVQYQAFTVPGTRGNSATSYNLCPSVFLVPPMGTKTGGRIFMPAIAQADISNNSYAGGYVTAIANLMAAFIGGMAGSGSNWQLCVFSRKNVSASLVSSYTLSTRIGFQSKRRRPVGSV